jgi:hypothetical protein
LDIFANALNGGGITIHTQNIGQTMQLGYFGGNDIILTINNTSVNITQPLLANGSVGVGTAAIPNNIFQVGDGGKLRMSNGQNDFTLIGTKDVDDANNTKIRISGNTRSGTQGDIDYIATTAVETHIFYTESTTQLLYIDRNEIYSAKKFTVYNGNYYTSGEFITYSSKTDSGGTFRLGYFISYDFFFLFYD